MKLVPVISKEGFVTASLHDLVSVPTSPYTLLPYAFYVTGYGKPLYALYYIEKYSLWNDLFSRIIGEPGVSHDKIEYVMGLLKSIDVYEWSELESILRKLGETVIKLYNNKADSIVDRIMEVYGFTKLFNKVYAVFGFNPLPKRSYGSMLYFDNEKTIVAVHVSDTQEPREILDVIIHEILHGLIRLNDIELGYEIEELVIDISCPEGYLSKMLGLVDRVNVSDIRERFSEYSELVEHVITYYDQEKYRETSIIEWVKEKLK